MMALVIPSPIVLFALTASFDRDSVIGVFPKPCFWHSLLILCAAAQRIGRN